MRINRIALITLLVFSIVFNVGCGAKTAEDYVEKAREVIPAENDSNTVLRSLNDNKVEEYNKKFKETLEYCNKAIELDPNYADAYFLRGLTYSWFKQSDKAISDYTKAIESSTIISDKAWAYLNRGYEYSRMGDKENAIKDFDTIAQLPTTGKERASGCFLQRERAKHQLSLLGDPIQGRKANIWDAAQLGYVAQIDRLINEQGIGVDERNTSGCTALMYAARAGNVDLVRHLVNIGANVNAIDKLQTSVIDHAARANAPEKDKIEIIKFLLEKNANVDGNLEWTLFSPLMAAVEKNNVQLVKFLINNNANVNAKNAYGNTVLAIAIKACDNNSFKNKNDTEIVSYLLNAGADPNVTIQGVGGVLGKKGSNTLLTEIAGKGGPEAIKIVRLLIAAGADVNARNKNGDTALSIAATNNNDDIAQVLREAGGKTIDLTQ